jgi:hypothetical protein
MCRCPGWRADRRGFGRVACRLAQMGSQGPWDVGHGWLAGWPRWAGQGHGTSVEWLAGWPRWAGQGHGTSVMGGLPVGPDGQARAMGRRSGAPDTPDVQPRAHLEERGAKSALERAVEGCVMRFWRNGLGRGERARAERQTAGGAAEGGRERPRAGGSGRGRAGTGEGGGNGRLAAGAPCGRGTWRNGRGRGERAWAGGAWRPGHVAERARAGGTGALRLGTWPITARKGLQGPGVPRFAMAARSPSRGAPLWHSPSTAVRRSSGCRTRSGASVSDCRTG